MTTETPSHAAMSSDHRTPTEQGYDFSEQVGHLLRKALDIEPVVPGAGALLSGAY